MSNDRRFLPGGVSRDMPGDLQSPFRNIRAFGETAESELQLIRLPEPDQAAVTPELSEAGANAASFRQAPAAPVREELRYGLFQSLPFIIGAASVRVLVAPPPNTRRAFLFIVNTHAVQLLFVNFGDNATANFTPINAANGAIGFDAVVPQNDIYLIANGAGTTCVLTYMNKGVDDYPSIPGQ